MAFELLKRYLQLVHAYLPELDFGDFGLENCSRAGDGLVETGTGLGWSPAQGLHTMPRPEASITISSISWVLPHRKHLIVIVFWSIGHLIIVSALVVAV
jgi:hypothetical protein